MELWTSHHAAPTRAADFAGQAEALGWHGITTVDSQNLSGDPYVFLALGATATRTLGLQTSVTNPVTRHPAVTATSALTVQKRLFGMFGFRNISESAPRQGRGVSRQRNFIRDRQVARH